MSKRLSTCLGACAVAGVASLALSVVPVIAAGPATPFRVTEASATPADATMHARYIVRYRNGTAQRLSTTQALSTARAALVRSGLTTVHSGMTVRHVRRLASGADLIAVSRPLDRVDSASLVKSLAADPSVASVEIDRRLQHTGIASPMAIPSDPLTTQYQWHFYNSVGGINAPAAWDKSTGKGVVVAVLDTGVTPHPDLDANLLPGYDFISDAFVSRRKTDERVPGAYDYGDWNDDFTQCDVHGSSFHGTHTAGTVAEVSNNGVGLAGVAHGAKVLPVRVLGRCGGYMSDIADAIVWASGGNVPNVPTNPTPAEVINMSLGGQFECDATLQSAIDTAVANGTTVVVSAGNSNADAANFSPASCARVVTVGATRITGGKAAYSNWGTTVDLSAPGGGGGYDGVPNGYVWQTLNDSATSPDLGQPRYGGMAGTSMSAPHVAATVALLQSIAPTPLTPAQVETTLKATTRMFPVAISASTPMGTGILNAKAVLATVLPPCQGTDCESNARPITNKVPVKGLAGATGAELVYALQVPVGATSLSFMTYGGTGDVSLLVRYGSVPTKTASDASSVHLGNNETVRIAVARGGTYYVKVVGVQAFAGVTLEARHL
jgi:serine protease